MRSLLTASITYQHICDIPAAPPQKKIIIPQNIMRMHIGANITFDTGASRDVSGKKQIHIGTVHRVVKNADKAILIIPPEYP